MIGFIVVLVAGAPLTRIGTALFVGYSVAVAAVLLAICYWKGEAPRWRWGKDE
jgi:hypothetical protein